MRYLTLFLPMLFLIISCSKDDSITPEITVTTSDFAVTIDENPITNLILGTIQGITNEGSVTFSITNQNPAGAISINSTTGELTVSDETLFDFETYPTITAIINVINGSVTETSNVTIQLNDLNETTGTGAWTLFSQEQVDAFGANGYTEVLYKLIIDDNTSNQSPITSLLPLSSLTKVGQDLIINNCPGLTSLEGLNNLESAGKLLIQGNYNLINLEGLNNLESTGTSRIRYNYNLINLNGLDSLTSVNGDLSISNNNESLTNLDGIESLSYVQGSLLIGGNGYLTNIDGLSGLLNVDGDLRIVNSSLLNLCGITNLFQNNGLLGEYVTMNGYNPTIDDILNGDCQL